MMLKQKPPSRPPPNWHYPDMMSRKPWNHQKNSPKNSFNLRQPEVPWREGSPYSYQTPFYNYQTNNKRDHYFLAPYYRNVMPPPPNPNRLLMIDPTRRRFSMTHDDNAPCYCRSRSMEDVSADVLATEWEDDINGNRVPPPMRTEKFHNKYSKRRSMENLLVDTHFVPPKRAGRLQVNDLDTFRVFN